MSKEESLKAIGLVKKIKVTEIPDGRYKGGMRGTVVVTLDKTYVDKSGKTVPKKTDMPFQLFGKSAEFAYQNIDIGMEVELLYSIDSYVSQEKWLNVTLRCFSIKNLRGDDGQRREKPRPIAEEEEDDIPM